MRRLLADWLDLHEAGFNCILAVFLGGIFLNIALSLWDKQKFPFTWRRVWSIIFFVIALRCIAKSFLPSFGPNG